MNKIFLRLIKFKYLFLVFFVMGTFLLLLNIFGLSKSLRNSEIYKEPNLTFDDAITLTEKEFYQKLKEAEKLPTKEFVYAVNKIVNQGMAHYWVEDAITKYNIKIPIWENFILFTMSFLNVSTYGKYEFCDYRKAVERGVGMCSQQAFVLVEILTKNKIKSNIIRLNGHIVVRVMVDENKNTWWVVDPDFGVLFEKDIYPLEIDPELIKLEYEKVVNKAKNMNPVDRIKWVETIVDIFITTGNNSISKNGIDGYFGKYYCEVEKVDYILIWIIPLIMIIPLCFIFVYKYRMRD